MNDFFEDFILFTLIDSLVDWWQARRRTKKNQENQDNA